MKPERSAAFTIIGAAETIGIYDFGTALYRWMQVGNAALEAMDPAKDADGLHPTNLGRLVLNEPAPLPCTARGIVHLLRRFEVPIAGAHVVVIGRGVTVGRPMGLLLTRRSENATVTLCHTGTRDLPALTRWSQFIAEERHSPKTTMSPSVSGISR